jgi:UDP-4-amino-4,6-dideoxy-N-acetyl-beta-L-altrosamine N-acetyltransferase
VRRLRPFTDADRQRLFLWRNDPEVARWMYTDHPISPDEHDAWFDQVRVDSVRHRYRILDAEGIAVAVASLTSIDLDRRSCTWGGYVVPGAGSHGHGRAALALSLSLAFDELQLNRVWIEALADNDRALHLYDTLGCRREAHLRELVWRDGRPRDVIGLSMLRSEWDGAASSIMATVEPNGELK